ncbi:PAS domain-containing protein [Marinobacter sp.]|uniref:PAS domain-containing protein n=1 Tax=Marinobacter sp. TaxID=50741 RepID=UPI002B49D606|nr:PAS domain-containing protein [Marinobacter sp.]HKK56467.1 PAS domain-containing protein [Marinobacter sp.]
MKAPEFPDNEAERQAALDQTGLLVTGAEERFDRLTRMARIAFRVPIALVSLIDRERQWFKSRQGLGAEETPRDLSFCGHAIHQPDLFIIENALEDERFRDNPLVQEEPRIRFYAGAPLHTSEGFRLGTLCIIDREPRTLDDEEKQLLRETADCVEREINLQAASGFYQELLKSEHRSRAVIAGTRVGTWEWNVQTGETVFNQRWAEICGYRLAELEPVNIQTWLDLAHPDDLAESGRLLQAHFRGELPQYDFRCRMQHKDGHWVWVHDRGQVFEWTETGEPLMMFGTHADISKEMNNLNRIQEQNNVLGILNQVALDPETDDDARIENALSLASRYLELPTGIVSEITGSVYSVRWFVAPESSGIARGLSFRLAETYCSLLLEKGDCLAITEMASSHFRYRKCYQTFQLESYLAAPIVVRGGLFGTLNFSSAQPRTKSFSDTEITFVTLLARWIGGILERRHGVQMLTKLVEQTPGMLYQFRQWPDGRSAFPYSSPHIRDIYGVDSDTVREDASEAFRKIYPDDLPNVAGSIERSAQTLSVWSCQYRVNRGNSRWRWVEGRATPEAMPDDSVIWHGYIADIDDSKRTEIALQQSEAQLRRLYELSPIGIALTEFRTGNFLDVNEALLKPTGYHRDDLMAMDFWQLLPGDTESRQQEIIRSLKSEKRFGPYEMAIRRADGCNYPAVMQGVKIYDASGRSLVWTLIEDISERKKVDRMKNEFIATVSHELRTPLTSIAGSLGLLAGGSLGQLPRQVDQLVSIAYRNSKQLNQLVDELLDMEKLISGKMTMNLMRESLVPIIQDSIEQLESYALEQEITVNFEHPAEDFLASIDRARLKQALNNLLSNAIKFSPDKGEVEVRMEKVRNCIRILVTDHGTGIPENFRARIFQKFAQADSSDTRGKRGTGLGLAITREIMSQMGGQVSFESVEGEGATFWLDLDQA